MTADDRSVNDPKSFFFSNTIIVHASLLIFMTQPEVCKVPD